MQRRRGNHPQKPIKAINPAMTKISMWPTIMLAAKRTDRLTGLVRYVNSSITIIKGARKIGVPLGKKKEKNFQPCLMKAIIVTEIKTMIAIANVIEIWLVTVNPYGITPNKLRVSMNMKILKIKGRYFSPFPKVLEFRVFRIKPCMISAND